ncbi:MAG: orotate phosphoribosyltransferase [Clostridiales bacterium]|jgi:orotate phosphoribosyltransferase|nr:orotate phosphoribosyltransferase [Clostridiales bacterium]
MIGKDRAEWILTESGALLTGHFILTSGRHARQYMQCAKVLRRPDFAGELCSALAEAFGGDGVELVAAPAMGGIIVGYEIARQLGVPSVFAERENGVMTFRRGFAVEPGQRVLVAEDVITTGGSVREVIALVEAAGGIVAGVAVLVDRSGGAVGFGVKKTAAYTAVIESFEPESCPLCAAGAAPAVKPGSRTSPQK